MTTLMKHMALYGMVIFLTSTIGCQETEVAEQNPATSQAPVAAPVAEQALQCQYKVGQSERAVITKKIKHENWVEMPDKEPAASSSRTNRHEITVLREVQSVDPDGSALVQVTVESVQVNLDINTVKSKSKHHYTSNKTVNDSTWGGEPEVAGSSYQIKVAPDTSVLEVIGLDAARSKLKIKEGGKGIVANLLTEASVKKLHLRSFVKNHPGPDVMMAIPDSMIKAQAIKATYAYQTKGDTVVVDVTGEALHALPEGVASPPAPTDPGQAMILELSELDTFTMSGRGEFDLSRSAVVSEESRIESIIILDGNAVSNKFNKPESQSDAGQIITVTEIKHSFKVLP